MYLPQNNIFWSFWLKAGVMVFKKRALLLILLLGLSACIHSLELNHSSFFSATSPETPVLPSLDLKKTEHKTIKVSSLFWGLWDLSAAQKINLWKWCSSMDYSLKISHSFPQWLALIFSFGVYIPYTLHIQCRTGA